MSENVELFKAISALEKEKNIPKEYMFDKIKTALITAVKLSNAVVDIDEKKSSFRMYVVKKVVEEVTDPALEISADDAIAVAGGLKVGDNAEIDFSPKELNRITATTAKGVIVQAIRESERGNMFQELSSKEHEILSAVVTRIDSKTGNVTVEIGSADSSNSDAVLPVSEQIRGEKLVEGQRIKVYLVEVRKGTKNVSMVISRTHPGLVKRLFELEVPEIHDGVVEIKNIAREAGSRTKISVVSSNSDVDPIGACVGQRGVRVANIVDALGGEKIDIIRYSEVPETYVSAALAPSDVISVTLLPAEKTCQVVVPDDQLSLAIGKEGQNARLAAKLTGMKIDIKPQSRV